tara:strand:- start:3657 stop:3881 length:225 start_codon:yes stop_codon:yes gene_type:complete
VKIEKNIKIPPARGGPHSEIGKLVKQMEVGDSVEVPNVQTVNAFRQMFYARGENSRQRQIKTPTGVRYRIWRTE